MCYRERAGRIVEDAIGRAIGKVGRQRRAVKQQAEQKKRGERRHARRRASQTFRLQPAAPIEGSFA